MAIITSNGTGGGVSSAGASWAGGVVPTTHDVQILSNDTITLDTSHTWGTDSATPALDVLSGGTLTWDGLGVDVLTCKGDFKTRNGCHLTLSGAADVTKSLTIKLNYSAALVNGKYGWINEDGSIVSVQGFNRTRSWDTLSENAEALQKVCVTTHDNSTAWAATDTFVVGSMTRVGITGAETDTIGSFVGTSITKAGGNYVYKHDANVAIINLTRNIIFTSYDVTKFGYILNYSISAANFALSWVRFTYLGYNATGKRGLEWNSSAVRGKLDYCVFDHCYSGLYISCVGTGLTHTGLVFYANTVGPTLYGSGTTVTRDTYTSLAAIGGVAGSRGIYNAGKIILSAISLANQIGIQIDNSWVLITSGRVYGNDTGIILLSTANTSLNSIYFDGNTVGISQQQGISTAIADNITLDVQVVNTTHISVASGHYALMTMTRSNIIPTAVSVSTTSLPGTKISISDIASNHKTWDTFGSYEKSSAVPRTGTYSLLMSPTNASNQLIAESTVPAVSGAQVVVTAYFRKNSAYGSATLPFLRLSGVGVTTSTSTLTDVNDTWQLLVASGTPTESGFCKVEFVAQSAGAGAAVYIDDVKCVYTAIDTGTFDYWYQGDLPPVLMATGLGATDVWAAAKAQVNAVGSIGELAQIIEKKVDDATALIVAR